MYLTYIQVDGDISWSCSHCAVKVMTMHLEESQQWLNGQGEERNKTAVDL